MSSKIKTVQYIEFEDAFGELPQKYQERLMKEFNFNKVWGVYLIPVRLIEDVAYEQFSDTFLKFMIKELEKLDRKLHVNFGV